MEKDIKEGKKYITVYCMYCNEPLDFQTEDFHSVLEVFVGKHECRKEFTCQSKENYN